MRVSVNGINVHYTLDGPPNPPGGPLSHSLAPDLSMWGPQMKALTARSPVRRSATPGHGGCCHAISHLDLTDKLGAIKIPTVVIVGEEDQGTPVAASQAIQSKIAGSQLQILKSAAHLSNMEQPEAFDASLTSFLSRLG